MRIILELYKNILIYNLFVFKVSWVLSLFMFVGLLKMFFWFKIEKKKLNLSYFVKVLFIIKLVFVML